MYNFVIQMMLGGKFLKIRFWVYILYEDLWGKFINIEVLEWVCVRVFF